MLLRTKRNLVVGLAAASVLTVSGGGVSSAAPAAPGVGLHPVPTANPKVPGMWSPNVLSPELAELAVAQGATRLENGTSQIPFYGYLGDGPMLPLPGTTAEASKTEPDKNTYLVLDGQKGSDPAYHGYGRRFLFQGHERAAGYITRINLDADEAHRVTLMASTDVAGTALPTFDGSTYDPFARRLLFTSENGSAGGVWAATLGVPSRVRDISGALGRGSYEGVQNDSAGNVWLVEDVGGVTTTANPNAKQPNSFVYRFVPTHAGDLSAGRLQVLQVNSARSHTPIVFHAATPDADILAADRKDLHTYGKSFATRWVTIHDTASDGTTPFDANAAAKAAGATPFKRPENGVFRPGSGFGEFFFTETGDTDLTTQAGAAFGGFGAVYRLSQAGPSADTGRLSMLLRGDAKHTGFDNISFLGTHRVAVVEDAGDTLHTQRNALDSGYLLDTTASYAGKVPLRFLAEGRDPSATIDSGLGGAATPGFQNDGDNEITGIHTSDGNAGPGGILGARIPHPFVTGSGWHVFYTAQHGDNVTFEIVRHRLGE